MNPIPNSTPEEGAEKSFWDEVCALEAKHGCTIGSRSAPLPNQPPTDPATAAEPSPTSAAKKIVPCVCGHPDTPNTIHRFDGPCYHHPASPQPAGAEPSPEEAAALEIVPEKDGDKFDQPKFYGLNKRRKAVAAIIARFFAPLRAELERVKGELGKLNSQEWLRDVLGSIDETNEANRRLRSDLTTARARIGELEKEVEQDRSSIAELEYMSRNRTTTRIMLRNALQLALANAKAEEARRAGVKCFDESHPT